MHMAFTGRINTQTIVQAIDLLSKDYEAYTLPICVEFDQVFDISAPARCISRNNIDNPSENLFYVTKPIQAVVNQIKTGLLTDGKYFSMLPCQSLQLENSVRYTNNLIVTAYIISEEDKSEELVSSVEKIYNEMGVEYKEVFSEDTCSNISFLVHGVRVCCVETIEFQGKKISVANIISEPTFSKVVRGVF